VAAGLRYVGLRAVALFLAVMAILLFYRFMPFPSSF
jgi:hypothetical protein